MKNTKKKIVTTVLGLSILIGGGISPLTTFAIYNPDQPVSSESGNEKQTRLMNATTTNSTDTNLTGEEEIMMITTTSDDEVFTTTASDSTENKESETQDKMTTTDTNVESEEIAADKEFSTLYLLVIGAVVLTLLALVTIKKKK